MAKQGFKSDAMKAIHSHVSDLHKIDLVEKQTMRKFDEMCIDEPPEFDAQTIANIRNAAHVSQPVFAHYLNTSGFNDPEVGKWLEASERHRGQAFTSCAEVWIQSTRMRRTIVAPEI
jgi:putative transcriptional regulator